MATIPIVDDGDTFVDMVVTKGPMARIVTNSPTVRDLLVAEGFKEYEEFGKNQWRFWLQKTEITIAPVKDVKVI